MLGRVSLIQVNMCSRSGKGTRKRGWGKGSRDGERHTKASNLGIGVSFDAKRGGKNYKARIHFRRRELVVGRYKTALEACLAHDQAIRMLTGFRDIRTNYEEAEHTFYDPSVDAKMRALLASMNLAPAPASSMLVTAAKTPPPNMAGPDCSSSAPPSVAADVADCLTSSGWRSPYSVHASYSQDDVVSAHSTSAVASPSAAAPAAAPLHDAPAPEAVSGIGPPDTSAAAAGAQPLPGTYSPGLPRNLQVVSMHESCDVNTQVAPAFLLPLGTFTAPAQATYAECSPRTSVCPADAAVDAPVPLPAVPCVVSSPSRFYHHHQQQQQHADCEHACAYSCSSSHSVCTYRMDCYSDSSAGCVVTDEPHAASAVAAWQYQPQQKYAAAAQQQIICPPVSESLAWNSVQHVETHRGHQPHQQLVHQHYQQQQQHHQEHIYPEQLQQMTAQHMLQQHSEYPAAQHAASRPYDEVDALLDTLLQMPLDQLHALA